MAGDGISSGITALDYGKDHLNSIIVIGGHLDNRYEISEVLGKGSFGCVCKCLDHETGELVAVKILANEDWFEHMSALNEINMLYEFCKWDVNDKYHVIRVKDYFYYLGYICIVTELLGMSLYDLIKMNGFRGFPLTFIRGIALQMLRALVFLGGHGVMHCDLKPENILLMHSSKNEIKIIDFGLSCFEYHPVEGMYLQTLTYRSPEVILGMSYGRAIDMWSMGCILAELYTGRRLFPGASEQDQLARIMAALNHPGKLFISRSPKMERFFNRCFQPEQVVGSDGKPRKYKTKTLAMALNCGDMSFVDFVEQCLRWNPKSRMTAENAMLHPFIVQIPQDID